MVVEVVTAVLVVVLGLATLVVAYIGVLGLTGALNLARCERCNKLLVIRTDAAPGTCTYCRHDRLLHPMHAVRQEHRLHGIRHQPS